MKIKCPLCRLNDLQNLEFKNYDELAKHCEEYHTLKTLAWSFIENYFAHAELREKIHEKIESLEEWVDMEKLRVGWKKGMYFDDFGRIKTIQELKSLLEDKNK